LFYYPTSPLNPLLEAYPILGAIYSSMSVLYLPTDSYD
jgi:hypothetical protein